MPRDTRNKRKPRNAQNGLADYTFVDIRLTKNDKDTFNRWAQETADDAIELLAAVVNSGYKLSVSWSDYNDCYTASFTGLEENSPNYHHVMTSRSDELWEAVLIGLYKHLVLCPDNTWPTDKQVNDWG